MKPKFLGIRYATWASGVIVGLAGAIAILTSSALQIPQPPILPSLPSQQTQTDTRPPVERDVQASQTSVALSQSVGVARGMYNLAVTLQGSGARADIAINNQQLAQFGATASPATVTASVYVGSPADVITVSSIPPTGQSNALPLQASNLQLAAITPKFNTQGNKIIDGSGNAYTFRGVNRGSLASTSTGWYLGYSDFNWMHNWGSNIVRLLVSDRFWLSNMCQYDPNYKATVDQMVKWINGQGMVADIALFNTTEGSTCPSYDFKLPKMDDTFSINFWQDAAARYKDNPLVVFEPVNEPHDVSGDIWRNGGTVDGWQAVGLQQLYNTIRSTGAQNLILIDGTGYSSNILVAQSEAIDGYGIVYAPHGYCNDQQSPQACAGGALNQNMANNIDPIQPYYPIVFTEFGKNHMSDSAPTYNRNFLSYANGHGYGWIAYQWAYADSDYGLLDGWTTKQPNAAGIPVRDALWAARGWTSYGGPPPSTPPPAPPPASPPPSAPAPAPAAPSTTGGATTPQSTTGGNSGGDSSSGTGSTSADSAQQTINSVAPSSGEVSGAIALPLTKNTRVYIDGKLQDSTLDTTTFTNGHHTLKVVTKNADGSTSTSTKVITIHNKLNPLESARNVLFKHWAGDSGRTLNIAFGSSSALTFGTIGFGVWWLSRHRLLWSKSLRHLSTVIVGGSAPVHPPAHPPGTVYHPTEHPPDNDKP